MKTAFVFVIGLLKAVNMYIPLSEAWVTTDWDTLEKILDGFSWGTLEEILDGFSVVLDVKVILSIKRCK